MMMLADTAETISYQHQPQMNKKVRASSTKSKALLVSISSTPSSDSLDDNRNSVWSDPESVDTLSSHTSVEDEDDSTTSNHGFAPIQLLPVKPRKLPATKRAAAPKATTKPAATKAAKAKREKKVTPTHIVNSGPPPHMMKKYTPEQKPFLINDDHIGVAQSASLPCDSHSEVPPLIARTCSFEKSNKPQIASSPPNFVHVHLPFHQEISLDTYHTIVFCVWKALSRFMHRFRDIIRDFTVITENEAMMTTLIHKFAQAIAMYNEEFPITGYSAKDLIREGQLQLFLDQVLITVLTQQVDSLFHPLSQQAPSVPVSPCYRPSPIPSQPPSQSNSPLLMPPSNYGTIAPFCPDAVPFRQPIFRAHPQFADNYQMSMMQSPPSHPSSPVFSCCDATISSVDSTHQSVSLMNFEQVHHQQYTTVDGIAMMTNRGCPDHHEGNMQELSDFIEYFSVEENWSMQEF